MTLIGHNILTLAIMNYYFNSLTFIALFLFHAFKYLDIFLLSVFIIMLHKEKNIVIRYFSPMKIDPKNKQNPSNKMIQTNRFLIEIMKIILKNFKFDLLRFSKNICLFQPNC